MLNSRCAGRVRDEERQEPQGDRGVLSTLGCPCWSACRAAYPVPDRGEGQ